MCTNQTTYLLAAVLTRWGEERAAEKDVRLRLHQLMSLIINTIYSDEQLFLRRRSRSVLAKRVQEVGNLPTAKSSACDEHDHQHHPSEQGSTYAGAVRVSACEKGSNGCVVIFFFFFICWLLLLHCFIVSHFYSIFLLLYECRQTNKPIVYMHMNSGFWRGLDSTRPAASKDGSMEPGPA